MAQDNNLSRNHDKSLITGRFTPLKIVPSGTTVPSISRYDIRNEIQGT